MDISPSMGVSSAGFLSGGGEMGRRFREHDWPTTSMGHPPAWPENLKTLVALMLSAQQPMFVAWGSERSWLYNDPFIPILGKKHPGALARGAMEEVWSEAREILEPLFERVFAGEPIHLKNFALGLDRNGHVDEANFTFSYTPIRDSKGAVTGLFGVCFETTEQVRAELRRAEDQERQRALFQKAPGFIAILRGPNHVFEFVNDAYIRLTGSRDFIGQAARKVFPDLSHQGFFEVLDRVYATGERFVAHESRIVFQRTPNGPLEEKFLDFIYEPVTDASDRVVGIFVEGSDVTERRRAEQALRELNATLEAKVEERTRELDRVWKHSRDLLVVIGKDGIFRSVSPAWTRVLGHEPAEVVGRSFLDFVHWEDAAWTQSGLDIAASGSDLSNFENRYLHKDRTPRWISWLTAVEGDLVYAYGRDITFEKKAQSELAFAQEALRQSQKLEAMGQLTGGLAHDFNNLLTPIIGGLDTLQRRKVGTDRDQRLIGGAIESAERAKTLVQRLLAFARRQPLQPIAVDVADLIRGMAGLVASTTGPQIEVTISAPDGVPPAIADPGQIEMAILNLCVNARDAMPNGGALSIGASAQKVSEPNEAKLAPGSYIRISVSDTGIGMDEITLARAIEPFFSTKGIGRGTGLGLSMVHGVATQLGGAMHITSTPSHGTTVDLWLPMSRQPVIAVDSETGAMTKRLGSNVVLLVDDEYLLRAITADMLIDLGFKVIEASSGEAALKILEKAPQVDLLITDHLMTGMSGTELARAARERRPEIPVLIISGYADVEGIAPDLPRLAKPFKQIDLADSLRALASLRGTK